MDFLPNIKSAAKRVKVATKRAERNVSVRSSMKTAMRRYEAELARGDAASAETALRNAVSSIDKAARKGVIHRNQADRRKSRLSAKLAALTGSGGQGSADQA